MLGQLDVVKAFVSASPGIQRNHGPHGITLLAHARAGRTAAEPVLRFLESIGGADSPAPTQPLDIADRDALPGRYSFGTGARDYFDVDLRADRLRIQRAGGSRQFLFHSGSLVFFPSGAPAVKIAFARENGRITHLTIANPEVWVTARRD
jgi:hypothetical protein